MDASLRHNAGGRHDGPDRGLVAGPRPRPRCPRAARLPPHLLPDRRPRPARLAHRRQGAPGRPLAHRQAALPSAPNPATRARPARPRRGVLGGSRRRGRAFLAGYGKEFGVADASSQLRTERTVEGARGSSASGTSSCTAGSGDGRPVGRLPGRRGATTSANGEVSPELDVDVTPRLSRATRRRAPAGSGEAHEGPGGRVDAHHPEAVGLRLGPAGAPGPRIESLVWRTEATSRRSDRRGDRAGRRAHRRDRACISTATPTRSSAMWCD